MIKRTFIPFIFIIILLLTGCTESYNFLGNGDNWKMDYQVTTSGQTEENKITLEYIGPGDPPKKIIYSINDGNYTGNISYPEDGVLVEGSKCDNCSTTQKSDVINVEILWDEKSEKFTLAH